MFVSRGASAGGSAERVQVTNFSMDSTKAGGEKATFTPSGSPSNAKKGTISGWFRCEGVFDGSTNDYRPFTYYNATGNKQLYFGMQQAGKVFFAQFATSGGYAMQLQPSSTVFTDGNWHHLAVMYDTTQATAADRVNIYIDGTLQTVFDTETYPALNLDLYWGAADGQHSVLHNLPAAVTIEGKLAYLSYQDGVVGAIADYIDGDGLPVDASGYSFGTNGELWDFEGSTIAEVMAGVNGTHTMTLTNLVIGDRSTDNPEDPA